MADKWVSLGQVRALIGGDVAAAIEAVLKVDREVHVRVAPNGYAYFYARVPLPLAARKALH